MAGRGPNAIDIAHPLGENESRFHEVRRLQRTRAICLRASQDHRDGLPLATPARLFVPPSYPSTPRIGCLRKHWSHPAAQPTRLPESYRRCLEALVREDVARRFVPPP